MNINIGAFTFSGRIRSIRHALCGLVEMLRGQRNAWIHFFATAMVVIAGWSLGVSSLEWCLLTLSIAIVWVSEALNTAFEFLCDVASPEFHPLVKKSKDVAAGAVLVSAVGAMVIGLIIFIPYVEILM